MGDEKQKQEQKDIEVPEILLMEREFEFVVPVTLEECVFRLREKVEANVWSSQKIRFEYLGDNTYHFLLDQTGSFIIGFLKAQNAVSTIVYGTIGMTPTRVLALIPLTVGVLFFLGASLVGLFQGNFASFICNGMLVGFIPIFAWSVIKYSHEQSFLSIEDTVYPIEERFTGVSPDEKAKN